MSRIFEIIQVVREFEKIVENKTIQEIHEIIQYSIEQAKKEHPNLNIKGLEKFYYAMEQYLTKRVIIETEKAFN